MNPTLNWTLRILISKCTHWSDLYTARVSVGKQKPQEFFHFMLVFKQRDGFSQQDAAFDSHLAFEIAIVQLQWVDEPFHAPGETCSC